jgi:excisionase family DNA binding protein
VDSAESFVDPLVAAAFLSIRPAYLLRLVRRGEIPAHALGEGKRRFWRFRLSELAAHLEEKSSFASLPANPKVKLFRNPRRIK